MTLPTRPSEHGHGSLDYLAFTDPDPDCPGYVLCHGNVALITRNVEFWVIVNQVAWHERWWYDTNPFKGQPRLDVAPQWLDFVQRHVRSPEWGWWRWAAAQERTPRRCDPTEHGAFLAAMVVLR